MERGESSPEVPGHITVIPAGIERPAKVAAQYGLGVLFFWSNSHNSTSIPSRVHGLHGMAWDGGEDTLAICTRLLTRPASTHARSCICHAGFTPDHTAARDLFLFSHPLPRDRETLGRHGEQGWQGCEWEFP